MKSVLDMLSFVQEYGQTALIANITPERAHANVAYERFTDTGPLALLTKSDNRCALVWTLRDDQVDAVMALDDAAFLARLQERFGQRLGRLTRIGKRTAYPLRLVRARESVRPRLALIGNAAHTLHPIAGQGFNLGVRDVAALAEVLLEARRQQRDLGDLAVLKRYAEWRQGDHRRVIAFTDGLTRLFPRSPMITAHIAWDLQRASDGRFVLGLGTQVKGHNERRFSVKFESPGPKLREIVLALRAIWDCFQNGTPLNFKGRFYTFDVMSPFFNPGPIGHPKIPVFIAAVNPLMCRVAGEFCEGMHVHPFNSAKYLREVVHPAVEEGLQRSGRTRQDFTYATASFVVVGDTPAERDTQARLVKQQM